MNDILNRYKNLIPFLGESLGNTFEAVLYDLTDPAYPVLAAVNSSAGNQERVRAFLAEAVKSRRGRRYGYYANHPIAYSQTNLLKTSAYFIRNDEDEVIGAVCLSVRCDFFMKMSTFAGSILRFNTEDLGEDAPGEPPALREPSLSAIDEMVRDYGVESGRATQEERLEIICDLYDLGVYNLKGAVARTAEALQVSEQSVYRYLNKIKRARDW